MFALDPWLPVLGAAFAACVLLARSARRRISRTAALLMFPAAWTSVEFINGSVSHNGTYGSFAYNQVFAPILIQSASLFGLWSVTFLICLCSNAIALLLREPHAVRRLGMSSPSRSSQT